MIIQENILFEHRAEGSHLTTTLFTKWDKDSSHFFTQENAAHRESQSIFI